MTQANKEELIAARDITADMPDLRVAEVQRIYLNLNPTGQLSQPGQITSCLEWAVVSDTGQKPLTEAQASKILAAYQAMKIAFEGRLAPGPLTRPELPGHRRGFFRISFRSNFREATSEGH
jgi:hypothetical protein